MAFKYHNINGTPFLPWTPDESREITSRISFSSTVSSSEWAYEQRKVFERRGKISMRFDLLSTDYREWQDMRNTFFLALKKKAVAVPYWFLEFRVEEVQVGRVLVLETPFHGLRKGEFLCYTRQGERTAGVCVVEDISGKFVTVSEELQSPCTVCKALFGTLGDEVSSEHHIGKAESFSVEFSEL